MCETVSSVYIIELGAEALVFTLRIIYFILIVRAYIAAK